LSLISINYNNAYIEANRLQNAASECDNLITQSQRAIADISAYWEGAAARAYVSAQEEWWREMLSIRTELNAISILIRAVTDAIREADERAAAAAKKE
jgi:WXG100 family type VII secretion target